jgi:tetratricopeptide (TPR) repeat protein
LLYRLLTGTLPYSIEDASPLEAARIILCVAPVPPSQAAPAATGPELRGDLDTILLQALRKEPERRYPTVAAFAEDIERHLSSQPVLAHADSFGYRAGKFLRRNRIAASAAAVVVILFVVSAVAILHSASVARRQRILAEQRFTEVRALAHSYIFDLDPQLEEVPGTMKVRGFILKNALKYLEAMSKEGLQDDSLAREIGRGYMRVSQVQADFGMPSLNDRAGAWDSIHKSYAIQMRLLEKNPTDMTQRGLMLSQMRLMAALAMTDGDVVHADEYTQRGLQLGRPTLAAGAKAPRYLTLISLSWDMATHRCGNGDLWNFADPVGALPWVDRMHELIEEYIAAHPADTIDRDAANMLHREAMTRAQIYRQIGRAPEARALYEKALLMTERYGTQDVIAVQSAKVIRAELASYLVEVHDVRGANAMAGNLLPKSFHEKGNDRLLTSDEADTLSVLARIDLESGRVAEGKRKLQQCMKTFEKLYAEDPLDDNTNSELAHAAVDIADQKQLDATTRQRLYTRGIQVAEAYGRTHPEVLSPVLLAGRAEVGLAGLSRTAQSVVEQRTHASAAVEDLQKILRAHPSQPQAKQLLTQAKALLKPEDR